MVNSVLQKVTYFLDVSGKCVDDTVSAIDKSMNLLCDWMNQCIQNFTVLDDEINLTLSNHPKMEIDPFVVSTRISVKEDHDKEECREIETEDSVFEKYNAMTMKDLKDASSKLGIACSGLRIDYIKKLVSYELNQKGIKQTHPISVVPRLHSPTFTNTTPVQRPTVIIPQVSVCSPPSSPTRLRPTPVPLNGSPRLQKPVSPIRLPPSSVPKLPAVKPPTYQTSFVQADPPRILEKESNTNSNTALLKAAENPLGKKIPEWAKRVNLRSEIAIQSRNIRLFGLSPDAIFLNTGEVDLKEVMGFYWREDLNERGSSGIWKDDITAYEEPAANGMLSDDGIDVFDDLSDSSDSWYSLSSE